MEFIVKCQIAEIDWFYDDLSKAYLAFDKDGNQRGAILGSYLQANRQTPAGAAIAEDWCIRNANNNN